MQKQLAIGPHAFVKELHNENYMCLTNMFYKLIIFVLFLFIFQVSVYKKNDTNVLIRVSSHAPPTLIQDHYRHHTTQFSLNPTMHTKGFGITELKLMTEKSN